MATVAALLAEHLVDWNVRHVFGIPGKPISPLIFATHNKGLRFVLNRHEAGSGFCAIGYSMERGLGVAIGTSGPGSTNLITGAAQAMAYHAPVLFLTGQPSSIVGKAYCQDSSAFGIDTVQLFESVTKFSACVHRPEQLPLLLQQALEHALIGKKGPVHLSLPFDVLMGEAPAFQVALPQPPVYSCERLDQVVETLLHSRKPVVVAGKGVHSANAYAELLQFAELAQVPVVTTPGGKGGFPTHHPLSLGSFGIGGTERAKAYVHEADLLLVMGNKLSDIATAGFHKGYVPPTLIQFDIDPTFIGKSFPSVTIPIVGDLKMNLARLNGLLQDQKIPFRGRPLFSATGSVSTIADPSPPNGPTPTGDYLSSVRVMHLLRECLPDDADLYGDDGSHSFYAIEQFDIVRAGTFHFDIEFGAMGNAIGISLGVKLVNPAKTVVCLTGDGCMMMHGTELSTAVNERAGVLYICLNNQRLDMVEKGMRRVNAGVSVGAVFQPGLQVADFARSLGAVGIKCLAEEEVRAAVAAALLREDMPTVIEILVDPEEDPPTSERDRQFIWKPVGEGVR